MAKLFIDYGVDINFNDGMHLKTAIDNNKWEIVGFLLSNGAYTNDCLYYARISALIFCCAQAIKAEEKK